MLFHVVLDRGVLSSRQTQAVLFLHLSGVFVTPHMLGRHVQDSSTSNNFPPAILSNFLLSTTGPASLVWLRIMRIIADPNQAGFLLQHTLRNFRTVHVVKPPCMRNRVYVLEHQIPGVIAT